MKKIKSIKLLLISTYLVGLGLLFMLHFLALDRMYPYIERGHYGRIRSILDDAMPSFEIEGDSNQLEYQKKMKDLTYEIIVISTKSLTEITAIMSYEKVVLLFGTMFYILSGWCVFRQSQKHKVFFYFGVLAWAIWMNMMGLIPDITMQNVKGCTLALNKFLQSTGQLVEPYEPVNFGMNLQHIAWGWRILTFVIFVALPGYFLFRAKITEKEKV